MRFSEIPENELRTGSYSKETIGRLMKSKRSEYRSYLRESAARNIPLVIGSYIAICSCLAGYALAYAESIFVFKDVYIGLAYLWMPFGVLLPVIWYLRRPSEKELFEELRWYREVLDAD